MRKFQQSDTSCCAVTKIRWPLFTKNFSFSSIFSKLKGGLLGCRKETEALGPFVHLDPPPPLPPSAITARMSTFLTLSSLWVLGRGFPMLADRRVGVWRPLLRRILERGFFKYLLYGHSQPMGISTAPRFLSWQSKGYCSLSWRVKTVFLFKRNGSDQ
jgi:hypothetical protein